MTITRQIPHFGNHTSPRLAAGTGERLYQKVRHFRRLALLRPPLRGSRRSTAGQGSRGLWQNTSTKLEGLAGSLIKDYLSWSPPSAIDVSHHGGSASVQSRANAWCCLTLGFRGRIPRKSQTTRISGLWSRYVHINDHTAKKLYVDSLNRKVNWYGPIAPWDYSVLDHIGRLDLGKCFPGSCERYSDNEHPYDSRSDFSDF